MSIKNKVVAITPFICSIAFFLIGFLTGKWHPAWMVFLLVPLMHFIVGEKKIRFSVPLVIAIIYVVASFITGLWHPLWVIFLSIPVFHIILTPTKKEPKDN